MRRTLAAAMATALLWPVAGFAQSAGSASDGVRVERLPVSLERIRQQLRLAEARAETADGALRLEYYVHVPGAAPKIDLFASFDFKQGPVPFSSPTHQEFLEFTTPKEYRSPPADLLSLGAFLATKVAGKAIGAIRNRTADDDEKKDR